MKVRTDVTDRPLYPEEAAEHLTVSLSTLYRLTREGRLRHIRLDRGGLRFRAADLDAYLDSCTRETAAQTAQRDRMVVIDETVRRFKRNRRF